MDRSWALAGSVHGFERTFDVDASKIVGVLAAEVMATAKFTRVVRSVAGGGASTAPGENAEVQRR